MNTIINQAHLQTRANEANLIGISDVTFDASKIFALEQNIIERIEVNFVFDVPECPPVLETFSLDRDNPTSIVSIQEALQLATDYSYVLTYHVYPECKANPYTSNVKTSNALVVNIDSPDCETPVPFIVVWGDDPKNNPDFIHFAANIYYDDPPYFPNTPASKILPTPDLNTPIEIVIDSSATPVVRNMLFLFTDNKLSPLKLVAQALKPDGSQMNWGPFHFHPENTVSLIFSKNHQFVSVSIDPTNVDWEINAGNASLVQINFFITAIHYVSQNTKCTMPIENTMLSTRWDPQKQRASCIFYKIPNLPVDYSEMAFDWTATYVYKSGVKYASGTQQGIALTLPTAATDATLTI